jgi:TPR repeat protein
MSEPARLDKRYDAALVRMHDNDAPLSDVASLLEAAHEAGDVRATYALATWYLHGRLFQKNVRRSVELLRKAAESDVPDALFDLAVCYEKGTGVAKNTRRAVQLYLRAALHGDKQSVYEIARCYYHGIGVQRDRSVARVWQDRAEEIGASDDA